LHRIADHNGEAARVVRNRQPGVPPLTACTGISGPPPSAVISRPGSRQHKCSRSNACSPGPPHGKKLVAGQTADDVYPEAVADADRAFALLQTRTCDASDASP
jgi:hypothetical protein